MSRARNIKPGFFKNDTLAECSPLARILFCGLWCEADREGRLEDRPKRIKADCLPYDDCDCDALLSELADRGFIVRYEANGSRYIAIPEFLKHQNPHVKEQASQIPAPNKHSACTVQEQGSNGESTEVAGLIPDSPSLIPDSPSQKGGKPPALTLPDWLPADVWADWHAYRNTRKGWTAHARKLSLNSLCELHAAGHDPRRVVELAIERGWTGLFAPRDGPPGSLAKPVTTRQTALEENNRNVASRWAQESDEGNKHAA